MNENFSWLVLTLGSVTELSCFHPSNFFRNRCVIGGLHQPVTASALFFYVSSSASVLFSATATNRLTVSNSSSADILTVVLS